MESVRLPLHFADFQCKLPPMELQLLAGMIKSNPQRGARCDLISLHSNSGHLKPTLTKP